MFVEKVSWHKQTEDMFPYQLPFFGHEMTFDTPVTILVGDNGSGKSTCLEMIAMELKLHRIMQHTGLHQTLEEDLKHALKDMEIKVKRNRPKGFMFSSEDFTSYIHYLENEKREATKELKRVNQEYQHKSMLSQQLAKAPFSKTIYEINKLYDRNLLTSSHGEAYLSFFQSRVHDNEFYVLDEPETPLSIQNQLTLLAIIDEGVKRGCQFVISTHSPIIMSIPYAKIYELKDSTVQPIRYEEIESVKLMHDFMLNKELFFKYLYKE